MAKRRKKAKPVARSRAKPKITHKKSKPRSVSARKGTAAKKRKPEGGHGRSSRPAGHPRKRRPQISKDVRRQLRGLYKGKRIVPGTNFASVGKKITQSNGHIHFRRDVALMFKEPLPFEDAQDRFNEWAPGQIQSFDDFVFRKVGVRLSVLVNMRVWGMWPRRKNGLSSHFDSQQRLARDLDLEHMAAEVESYLRGEQSPKKKKKAFAERHVKKIAKVAGYSLYLTTVAVIPNIKEYSEQVHARERKFRAERLKKEGKRS